jgi:hypothetical protein
MHQIEAGLWQLQPVDVADLESHVPQTSVRSCRPRPLDHAGLEINPQHLARRHGGGDAQGQRAGPTAEVYHAHACAQTRRQVRGVSLERPLVEEIPRRGVAGQRVLASAAAYGSLSRGPWAIRV